MKYLNAILQQEQIGLFKSKRSKLRTKHFTTKFTVI